MEISVRKLAPGETLQTVGRLTFKAPLSPSWGVFHDGVLMVDINPLDAKQMFSIWPQKYTAEKRAETVRRRREILNQKKGA